MRNPGKIIWSTEYTSAEPMMISDYLKSRSPISGRRLRQYFFKGLISLNGKKAHSGATLKSGDKITVFDYGTEQPTLQSESGELEIIFENDQLIVINKPALIVVHPSGTIKNGTLANRVAAYFEQNGLKAKVRPVNRLDYGTSGLVIFAKDAVTQEKLSLAIAEHRIKRVYYALVKGKPKQEAGLIDLPIGELHGKRVITEQGKPSRTNFRVVQNLQDASLLELVLETGRTHQIRVHLKAIGLPILGDREYGVPSALIRRPALHAGKLDFTGSEFGLSVLAAPWPADFQNLLDHLNELPFQGKSLSINNPDHN